MTFLYVEGYEVEPSGSAAKCERSERLANTHRVKSWPLNTNMITIVQAERVEASEVANPVHTASKLFLLYIAIIL